MSEESKPTWPGDWDLIDSGGSTGGVIQTRQKVPGGWLVMCANTGQMTLTFFPDPQHEWNPPLKQSRKKNKFD